MDKEEAEEIEQLLERTKEGDDRGRKQLLTVLRRLEPKRKRARVEDGTTIVLERASVKELRHVLRNDVGKLKGRMEKDAFGRQDSRWKRIISRGLVEERLRDWKTEKIGEFEKIEGLEGVLVLRRYLEVGEQVELATEAWKEWTSAPYARNTDERGLWQRYEAEGDASVLDCITWATFGKHYDWTLRKYVDVAGFPSVPKKLQEVSTRVVDLASKYVSWAGSFRPEGGICNFYRRKAVMGGHRDDAEDDHVTPVVSISIGPSAVFLISPAPDGGRDVDPVPIRLDSGDVLLFGGPQRLATHGIAGTIPDTAPPELLAACSPLIANLLQHRRININVRQIYAT